VGHSRFYPMDGFPVVKDALPRLCEDQKKVEVKVCLVTTDVSDLRPLSPKLRLFSKVSG
jgi:hypothetical protein